MSYCCICGVPGCPGFCFRPFYTPPAPLWSWPANTLTPETERALIEQGVAIAAGIVALGEWGKRCGTRTDRVCHACGYDQRGPHPNSGYSGSLYRFSDALLCGLCADKQDRAEGAELEYIERGTP